MANHRRFTHEDAVALSKSGTHGAFLSLLTHYISGERAERDIAATAIKKAWNREGAIEALNERLQQSTGEDKYKLLKLGIRLNRAEYLADYLDSYLKYHDDSIPLSKEHLQLATPPLSDREKLFVQRHIILRHNYHPTLLKLCSDYKSEQFYNSVFNSLINDGPHTDVVSFIAHHLDSYPEQKQEEFFDVLLDILSTKGLRSDYVSFIAYNKEYLELLQPEIREAILSQTAPLEEYGRFLNPAIQENKDIFMHCGGCIPLYPFIANNCWGPLQPDEYEYPINAAICIRNNSLKDLPDQDIEALRQEIDSAIAGVTTTETYNDTALIDFFKAIGRSDFTLAENCLIKLDKQSRVFSDLALRTLSQMRSKYAYREMTSVIIASADRSKQFRYAIALINNFPERSAALYHLVKDMDDEKLAARIADFTQGLQETGTIDNAHAEPAIVEHEGYGITVLDHNIIISDLIAQLCNKISANALYAAVGFVFSSGIRLLEPALNAIALNNGHVELIAGSLQNSNAESKQSKIDKSTVKLLNSLHEQFDFSLFAYREAFYHGKFYYISNGKEAYVISGSSNISKTAYLDNYEFDTLVHIPDAAGEQDQFIKWYRSFKAECEQITHLDESKFNDLQWDSEQDAFTNDYIKKVSTTEIQHRIDALTDEDTKFRLNMWMSHQPADIYSELGINALDSYVVFLFPANSLAVFESFTPGNAYYTFRYDDFERLLSQVAGMTKTQMMISSNFLNRGYHIQNKERLTGIIARLFAEYK